MAERPANWRVFTMRYYNTAPPAKAAGRPRSLARRARRWNPRPLPVAGNVVIGMGGLADSAVVLRQILHIVDRRLLDHVFRHRHHIAALVRLIVEHRPGDRRIFFADAERAAETQHAEHDVIRGFVEDDVFDLANLVAG